MSLEDSKMQKPTKPCNNCGGSKWWQRISVGHYVCGICHPDLNMINLKNSVDQRYRYREILSKETENG